MAIGTGAHLRNLVYWVDGLGQHVAAQASTQYPMVLCTVLAIRTGTGTYAIQYIPAGLHQPV